MSDNRTISVGQLKSIGYEARDKNAILGSLDLDGQNIRGCCISIAGFVRDRLIERTQLTEESFQRVKCQFKGQEIHYFVQIRSEYIDGISESGTVYIDPALDQFCVEQEEIGRVDVSVGTYDELPRVAVIQPSDKRKEWYQNKVVGV